MCRHCSSRVHRIRPRLRLTGLLIAVWGLFGWKAGKGQSVRCEGFRCIDRAQDKCLARERRVHGLSHRFRGESLRGTPSECEHFLESYIRRNGKLLLRPIFQNLRHEIPPDGKSSPGPFLSASQGSLFVEPYPNPGREIRTEPDKPGIFGIVSGAGFARQVSALHVFDHSSTSPYLHASLEYRSHNVRGLRRHSCAHPL